MQIGKIILPNRVLLAPMAGITDKSFRLLAREQGCGLVHTEMISAQGLLYGNQRTLDMLPSPEEGRPLAVQLFGHDPETMARAAQIVATYPVDIIDINMGCPVEKVVKSGGGAALLREPRRAAQLVAAVTRAVSLPVTVKIRKGWDEGEVTAVPLARCLVAAGAQALSVHGRTRRQMYGGRADWNIIRQVQEAVPVPVWGNGDLWKPKDAARMLAETGCAGVLLARGTLGNPWLISRTIAHLSGRPLPPPPSPGERVKMALRHLDLICDHKGEDRGVVEMRKFAAWYLKGLPHSAGVRARVSRATSRAEMKDVLRGYLANIPPGQV